ncbi:enoyl-CoA hydratase/isomerase family protein [Microbacterium sp. No. 7]|uniref:enoyl-CoA hydratase/isomerase family protein n=1 Tax=Microbacterium sp. No. 7 TaxID=1714373 RepID=UPI0006D1EE88|nr:enoyl-CoA hydratase/isomerase family protein [Microbacterium sp. No. 7]ALJ21190.1 hypothetical protein AOA12_15285 [Microbacterium sp. No. 7]
MADIVGQKDGNVLTILLNRPERKNAFTHDMIEEWVRLVDQAREDHDVHVVVLTGAGDTFCAGVDTSALTGEKFGNDDLNSLQSHVLRLALTMEELDKPVIAAINGAAVGAGLGLALQPDLRFFSSTARVSEAYINWGSFPGDGDTHYLPRLVGTSKALEMMWTGDPIDAQEALRIGLANRVYEPDELMPATYEFAHRLADRPRLAVRAVKRAVYASERETLRDAVGTITAYSRLAGQSPDREKELRKFFAGKASKKKDPSND